MSAKCHCWQLFCNKFANFVIFQLAKVNKISVYLSRKKVAQACKSHFLIDVLFESTTGQQFLQESKTLLTIQKNSQNSSANVNTLAIHLSSSNTIFSHNHVSKIIFFFHFQCQWNFYSDTFSKITQKQLMMHFWSTGRRSLWQ